MKPTLLQFSLLLSLCLFLTTPAAYSATFTVSNLNDGGTGSVADAINASNSSPGADSIHFSVAGVINLNGQLPPLLDEVVIDGTTAPGYVPCGAPVVAFNYVGGAGAHGLLILAGGAGSTILALNIRNFTAAGISSENSANITIKSCYIGTDFTGNAVASNQLGIFLLGSPDCVVGGDSCERNVVSGNAANGIAMELGSHRTVVAGNYVGLGADGVTRLGNGLEGIYAYNSDSLKIGLAAPGMGNTVVGAQAQGIHLNGGGGGSSNALIYNNRVGTIGVDSIQYGNYLNGIFIEGGTSGTVIGGTGPYEGNEIGNNGLNGIQIDTLNSGNRIVGNSIYCNADSGIYLVGGNNLIQILPNLTSAADSVFGTNGTPGNEVHAYQNVIVGDSTYCDCEGEVYIGSATIDASGNWSIVHNRGLIPAEQASVTATQTDSQNNTSQFYEPCTGGTVICPPPVANFGITDMGNGMVSFSDNSMGSGGPLAYSWDFGDGNTDSVASPSYTFSADGDYVVCLTITDRCGSDSRCDTVTIMITATGSLSPLNGLEIFPNPVNDKVYITTDQTPESVTLYDVLGNPVIRKVEDTQIIDVRSLQPGIYFLEVVMNQRKGVKRILVNTR